MPPTEPVDAVLSALAGVGRKRAAAGAPGGGARPRRPRAPRAPTSSLPVRGPGGRFTSGRRQPGSVGVSVYDPSGNFLRAGDIPAGVGASERQRLRAIRSQRRVVLQALREARARRLRDGTIKRLRVASSQLLARSRLTRGL